jgi:hypothetical protein
MAKIKSFNHQNTDQLHQDIFEALLPVAEKYGLHLCRKHYTYRSSECPVGLKFKVVEEDDQGNTIPLQQAEFNASCRRYDLEPSDYGREFKVGRRTFKLTGIKPRATKYPFIGDGPKGGRYKFTRHQVLSSLGK